MLFLAPPASYLRLCILSALGLCAMSATAATANPTSDDSLPQVELDEIVVTATRTPTKISNTIAQTRVIDKEQLQRYQGQTALEVLTRQPGISYYGNGGMDKKNNFYMRGYAGNQILVLIDGIRYSALSDGSATLNLLPIDQIDRIEIVYGASGSSIYGADAMGGVIQVFTKGDDVRRNQFSVTTGAGSNDQYLYGATAQFTDGNGTALSLSASHNETDGINATFPSNSFNYNRDDDGYDSNNFSLSLNKRINEQWLTGASAIYNKSTSEFDSGIQDAYSDQKNGAAQAFVDWRYSPDSSVKLQYGHSIDESETYSNFSSTYDSKQDQISLIGQHLLPVGKGIYGAEYLRQIINTTAYDADNKYVKSAFLGYLLNKKQFDGQINVRFDDNSQFGDETTYNVGGAYYINPDLKLGVSYAKGFRAPTFYDIYSGTETNIDLDPETSDNYELFASYTTLRQSTRLTGYYNKVDDLINFVARFDDDNNYIGGNSQNIEKAKIKGITLTSDWEINDYLIGGSYDYQKAEDDSNGINDGNVLPIRPEHKGLFYVGYRLPNLDLRAEYQYVDDYYYNISNADSQLVESYGLFNISGNYQLTDNLSMTARLNNITNKKYVTAPNYNTDGTNFFTSLTYNWY